MKLLLAVSLIAIGVSQASHAESLTLLKWDIENDIRVAKGAHQLAVKSCDELEIDIAEFNRRNDAQNAELAAKRALKRISDQQLADFQKSVDLLREQYNTLLGTIWSKKVQLVAMKGAYLAELIRARDAARFELIIVSRDKRNLERKLRDLDNFPTEADYLAALKKFYELKDREATLFGIIVELEFQIRNPVFPNEGALRAEIAALEAKAANDFRVLAAKTVELGTLIVANKKLGIEIAVLEAKTKSFKNFEVPAICAKF